MYGASVRWIQCVVKIVFYLKKNINIFLKKKFGFHQVLFDAPSKSLLFNFFLNTELHIYFKDFKQFYRIVLTFKTL
jgi:hypothetical protein